MNKTESPEKSTEDTTQTAEQVFARIRETLVLSEAQRTMERPPAESLSDSERNEKKRQWQDKWLPMKITHPQVQSLRDEAHAFCMDYANHPAKGCRLIIYGENGAGKSRIAKKIHAWATAVASRLPRVPSEEDREEYGGGRRTATSEFYHFPTLLRLMMKDFDRDMIDELCRPPMAPNLLVLDDVGAEHDPSKFGATQLYLILERRATMWTLITTNAAPEAWESKWDRRVSSRLVRNSRQIAVDKVPDFSTI